MTGRMTGRMSAPRPPRTAKLRFLREFVWLPRPSVTVIYPAGGIYAVTRACAARALAAGAAERIPPAKERRHGA